MPDRTVAQYRAQSLALRAVGIFGGTAFVHLVDRDRRELVPCAVATGDDDGDVRLREMTELISLDDPLYASAVVRGGASVIVAGGKSSPPGVHCLTDQALNTHGIGAVMLTPLRARGRTIAQLGIVVRDDRPPLRTRDVALLTRFAEEDALADESIRVESDLEDSVTTARLRHRAWVLQLSAAICELDVVSALLADGVLAARCSGGAFITMRAGRAVVVATSGTMPDAVAAEGFEVSLMSDHPFAVALRAGEALFVTSSADVVAAFGPTAEEKDVGYAVLPLRIDLRSIGVFVVRGEAAQLRDVQRRGTLRLIARESALALERARLYDAQQRAVARLERLADFSAVLAGSTSWEGAVTSLARILVPSHAQGCAIEIDGERSHAAGILEGEPVSIPLKPRDEVVATLLLYGGHRINDREDQLFLDEILRRGALALDTARTLDALQRAVHARDEFLAVAGHELRTPLTTLKMWVFAVEQFGSDGPVDTQAARRQITRLERLVEGVLDVGRMGDTRVALDLEQFDLGAAVIETVTSVAPETEVLVEGNIQGRWDRFRLSQVVSNLLVNAIKYGCGNPVTVRVERDATTARVRIRDRGLGIEPADQQRIFLRFERAVSSRNYAGLGIGLWIADRIVRAHGGAIQLESQPGVGSEFTIELPLEVVDEQ